jgi:long-chain fatty acid transport protein
MKQRSKFTSAALMSLSFCLPLYGQTGHVVHGVGAVNQSMAGAGTAMPLDATGALFWNPGSITVLRTSEVDINADLGLIDGELSSSLAADSLGPGLPARTVSGSSQSDLKKAFFGSLAWVQKSDKRRWTYGLLLASVGGFGFKYKSNQLNPITTRQPPSGVGVGDILTNYELLQVAPTVAYEVHNHFSAGLAANLDFATLEAHPFPFTSPDDANHDGFPTYPNSNRSLSMGGGIQGGLYYETATWHAGVSTKSPQWFDSFEFSARDEIGRPRTFKFTLNYPMIITTGIGYSGWNRLKWAADVRYIDYQDTKGFKETGFDSTGAVKGLGWKSIWVFATGLQIQLSDQFSIRAGYGLNGNPIKDVNTFFNLASPLITQHQSNIGFSYQFRPRAAVSFAYHHGFENNIQGPFQSPLGSLPDSSVRSAFGNDVLALSFNIRH